MSSSRTQNSASGKAQTHSLRSRVKHYSTEPPHCSECLKTLVNILQHARLDKPLVMRVQLGGLFHLILYVPSTIFQLNRDRSSWVEPVLS